MKSNSRNFQTNRPLGSQTSKTSKSTESQDAVRIFVALIFIALASVASVDKGALKVAPNDTSNIQNTEQPANPAHISWGRLLLEALHRIV